MDTHRANWLGQLAGEVRTVAPLILTLLAAFALMTLVACANLSGIYHARVAGRASDFSIRFALGASRARIVRQVLLEGVVLACIGGALACAGAWLTVDRLQGHVFSEGREAPMLYLPAPVASARTQQLVVRVPGGSPTGADLRALCRAYDANALCQPMTLRALLDRQQVPFTVAAEIASGLGSVTLVLACIGLYGLVSFSVVRQARDIGIRMALGATQRTVLAGVLRGAGVRMMHGTAFGLPAAAALLALLEWQVPMIETFDPAVFVLVPALLLAAGVATALVPARRAARVDPVVSLRRD